MRIEYVLVAAALFMLWYWWRRRAPGRGPLRHKDMFLILYDGNSIICQDAKMDESGNIVSAGVTYPSGVARRIENDSGSDAALWMVAAESLALAHHRTLEIARRHIVMGSIFKSGGDLIETVRMVAQAAVIACALYGLLQVSSLSTQLAKQSATMDHFSEVLSKPLVAVPPAVTPTASVVAPTPTPRIPKP